MLFGIQTSLPESDDTRVDLHAGSKTNEIPYIHRDHNLISCRCMGEDRLILSASKPDVDGRFCWNSLVASPTGQTRAEVFIDQ